LHLAAVERMLIGRLEVNRMEISRERAHCRPGNVGPSKACGCFSGLLAALRSQESRIDFKKENNMATKRKILVLVSSGHGLPLKDGKAYKGAGYYLNELTVPVRALMKEG
jgi:hypothetical protein